MGDTYGRYTAHLNRRKSDELFGSEARSLANLATARVSRVIRKLQASQFVKNSFWAYPVLPVSDRNAFWGKERR